ncbi:TROVE domain-containing protein [Nakamurella sp. YIM 132087]|uniref:TROVE domain-containing protein n=1 Tax=Nakamurella alba TaxID=2665158 RepID=A0A7K1FJ10_9ACTN|nr:TROVE domain-containing protein [Nakamurella alba]MTD14060.1 TROVE domain-containing protein [Nakamurella alba]
MSIFNRRAAAQRPVPGSPITAERTPSGVTHEGAPGFARDRRGELFLVAVAGMVGQDSFYERAADRDDRFVTLVRASAVEDPEWTTGFLRWVRTGAGLRTASLVGAAEFVHARLAAGITGGNRDLVASVLRRADEPGEFLGYWTGTFGRALPQPVKRGVADAVVRLYTERSLLKWDSAERAIRFGDVIELVHPRPSSAAQGALFRRAIEVRHDRGNPVDDRLPMLARRAELGRVPVADRRAVLADPDRLAAAGVSWEALAGWLQGPLDAAAWQAVIPSMGYLALLRNLRNFDVAGVPDDVAAKVAARLADPDEVSRSTLLPLRYLAAYLSALELRWAPALEKALQCSLTRVPALPGRTLVLVDRSGSMFGQLAERSRMTWADAAALFGSALAVRAESADLVAFGTDSERVRFRRGESVLRVVGRFGNLGGTNTAEALRRHWAGHDRVVIVTDEQAMRGAGARPDRAVPAEIPIYTWNLLGYRFGHSPSSVGNRHTFGGLTDAGFDMIPLLEAGEQGRWPFAA